MNSTYTIMLSLAFLLFGGNAFSQKAFPTAEGFGKKATGGRGGQVVFVTNLEDDANGSIEGSFRWAIKQYPNDPLTVIFRVSGNIRLAAELKVARTNGLTIAGQTAPGQGISFSHNKVNFGGSKNFILRNIRSRIGPYDNAGNIITENSFGAENAENFIIDHCTFGWSGEENMNTFDTHFHTVQWCIIHEGLYDSGHVKGDRSYASQWGGSSATYHHNLLAHNYSRSCRFNGSRGNAIAQDVVVFIEYINNVNYNWGKRTSIYGGENTSENARYNGHDINMINNYYKPGPVTSSDAYCFVSPSYAREGATALAAKHGPSQWHISGNVMEANGNVSTANAQKVTENNWEGVDMTYVGPYYSKDQIKADTLIFPTRDRHSRYVFDFQEYSYFSYETAEAAFESVLAGAGALPHDPVDLRIINDVRNGLGNSGASMGNGIINDPLEVGGYPQYSTEYNVVVDADMDGMDDAWEIANHLDPSDPTDRNKLTSEGYTALEVYINGLMNEHIEHDFTTGIHKPAIVEFALLSNITKGELNLISDAELDGAYIFNTNGVRVMSVKLTGTNTIQVSSLPQGQYILIAYTKNMESRAFKFVKK